MTTFITGASGFIGYHASLALLEKGEDVVEIDNLNSYHDPSLKFARLDRLAKHKHFSRWYLQYYR